MYTKLRMGQLIKMTKLEYTLFVELLYHVKGKRIGGIILKFQNMKIRNKIITIYVPLLIIPLFLVIFTSNNIFTNSIVGKTQKNILDESSLIVLRIEGMLSNAETCANMLTKEINKVNNNNINSNDPASFVTFQNQILGILSYGISGFKEIDSAAYIDVNSNIISTDSRLTRILSNDSKQTNVFSSVLESELVKTINQNEPPENIWFPMQIRDYLVTDIHTPIITLGKRVLNIDTGNTMGFLILNIKEDTISSVFPNSTPGKSKEYFILDKNGMLISSRNKQDLLKPVNDSELTRWAMFENTATKEIKIFNKPYMLTASPIKELDWKLINQISVSDLTSDTYTNTIIIFIVGIICIAIVFISAFFLSRLIANPITKLTKVAKEVRGGNLNVSCKVASNDEVGLLAAVFNEMIIKTKELISNVKLEQKKKREIELALIQSQIKPHFLYNSLDLYTCFAKWAMYPKLLKQQKH